MGTGEFSIRVHRAGKFGSWLAALVVLGVGCAVVRADAPAPERLAEGRDLFLREWTPGDSRSHGGDGLGPVYNDTSCVACHNAGGVGGGGPRSKNVDIVSAFPTQMPAQTTAPEPPGFFQKAMTALAGIDPPKPARPGTPRKPDTRELIQAHAGFRTARSVVLHRFGTDPDYESWRRSLIGLGQFNGFRPPVLGRRINLGQAQAELDQMKLMLQIGDNFQNQGQIGEFALVRSQRNPTALFGAGLIDSIPTEVLEAAARVKHPGRAEIAGRVSRQKDGRIGRFGWKAQTPSLNDFVRTACAVELGLDVPGHHQGGLPRSPESKPSGLDLTDRECDSLLAYVASLPKPAAMIPSSKTERETIAAGKALFEGAGCATCHTPKLGDVEGIYSDLLLHDMGPDLGDTGAYGVFVPDSSEPDVIDSDQPAGPNGETVLVPPAAVAAEAVTIEVRAESRPDEAVIVSEPAATTTVTVTEPVTVTMTGARIVTRPTTGPASRQEWRTPPLWGFRDSGPYLHDGRAATLEEAVALHGGEAAISAREFFRLSPRERQQVNAFLKTLTAPVD
jgi:CxxC motif-containing protein (DUF1111 family)